MNEHKHEKKCLRCKTYFKFDENNSKWDYGGYTITKLAQCPECGCWQAVKFEAENNLNFDKRYY